MTGPAGSGKTHFLNYVTALNAHAGQLDHEAGRAFTIALTVTDQLTEPERSLAMEIARELGDEKKAARLWRDLPESDVFRIALDEAKRQGVRMITTLIDFSSGDVDGHIAKLKTLAEIARGLKALHLIVVAAGRHAIEVNGVQAYSVGYEPDEEPRVVIGRARYLGEAAAYTHAIGPDWTVGSPGEECIPFHPEAVRIIRSLAEEGAYRVAAAARLARAVLIQWQESSAEARIRPTDLLRFEAIREAVEGKLGEGGAVAMRIAEDAASKLDPVNRVIADKIVALLVLHRACGFSNGICVDELHKLLCERSHESIENPSAQLVKLIEELSALCRDTVSYDRGTRIVRFNPDAASAPAITAFNAAIAVLRRFDATLTPVQDSIELKNSIDRLRRAMTFVLEGAVHNHKALNQAGSEFGTTLRPEQLQVFDEYVAIAEAGPHALIAAWAENEKQTHHARTLSEYDTLAALAAALPRIRAMREYLEATGLDRQVDDDVTGQRPYRSLETECRLLEHDLRGSVRAKTVAALNALEARFERFKWTYTPVYRAAHDEWQREMERAARLIEDLRVHLSTLARLNGIVRLGAPEGAELENSLLALEPRVLRCTLEGQLAPEVVPRCSRCNYVLGTLSPRDDLEDLLVKVRRALTVKLTALSRSAIARLIQEHDQDKRFEGFLRIVQAAQTDALTRVFDDKLARYLSELLDENCEVSQGRSLITRSQVAKLRVATSRSRRSKLNPQS